MTSTMMTDREQPTLEEFFKFLASNAVRPFKTNRHWMPMANLCLPCTIKYDYFGVMDDMSVELEFILKKALGDRFPNDFEIPPREENQYGRDHRQLLNTVDETILEQIKEKYSYEFEMFSRISKEQIKY